MLEEEENTLKYLRLPLQPQSFFQLAMWVEELQKSTAWCAKHAVKQDPGRAMQNSKGIARTSFTKPCGKNFSLLWVLMIKRES